ncbi:cytochrome oxidase assembly protein [Natrarchaeobius halalkaliphilus]|uniref:Cytochrome oxidase assembly protein n=1 Tax=Natrarchaeobius halalkaliphilus TaxID=1679091 RepID=A0A3N6NYN1_9EURY|nr:cytochrome oxidase assembly protein [Natrarchaeobius halalkaliphilus]RQG89959.1 cytochrome oxidase assembly protein [Natrarchaeobius halalkaliphilus]
MSTDNSLSRTVARPIIARFGFPQLLATTLVLVGATILLGVAAKATGSGLACEANWPQCDAGPYNLFPANLPSFYEWFHRFVAMFAGFAIIGSALAAWRIPSVDKRVATLVILGTILTPIQIVLGRETVLQYEMTILSLHFWTAVLIFVLFVVATAFVWKPRLDRTHVTGALVLTAASLPLHVALSPLALTDITEYSPTVQMIQYAVTLALLAGVIVAVMVGRWRFEDERVRLLLSVAAGLALIVVFLGRRAVMTFNPALDYLYVVASAVLFVVCLGGIWLSRRDPSDSSNSPSR